jgi:hypothetical protein
MILLLPDHTNTTPSMTMTMKVTSITTVFLFVLYSAGAAAFSLSASEKIIHSDSSVGSRRAFLSTSFATVVGGTSIAELASHPQPAHAVTAKEIITTTSGIKYAITKEPANKNPAFPRNGELTQRPTSTCLGKCSLLIELFPSLQGTLLQSIILDI